MRYFNTSGPCDPEKHYTVRREALIAKGRKMVEQGRYCTIFAPRQAGKTTFFMLLLNELRQADYTPIWVSFENLKTVSREKFFDAFQHRLARQLALHGVTIDAPIHDPVDLSRFFEELQTQVPSVVLVIDEFEGTPDCVLSEVMHTFRQLYHDRPHHALHSIMLVGVSTVAELVVSSASPFNITDELHIPYFTQLEVHDLIRQYEAEAEQNFDEAVVKAIFENTQGQPGLVCGLCAYLVENVVTEREKPVTMAALYPTLKYFLTQRFDKNILNIVRKAREKRDFMLRLLFSDTPIEFTVDVPDIAYLYAHGVIDSIDGYVGIPVPLYGKRLITAFRPLINGEVEHYTSAHDTFDEYITPQGLNLHAIIAQYRDYVRRRGFRAFDTDHLKEGAWHYSLDGFINFFIEQFGGRTFIETPTGRGRTDILILYKHHAYIIETKVFTTAHYFQKGKGQLAEYLASEKLDEGYYVVFSNKHTQDDQLEFTEDIQGKHIHTYIICTRFKRPTDLPVPQELQATSKTRNS